MVPSGRWKVTLLVALEATLTETATAATAK
jgi:hypothetical protein